MKSKGFRPRRTHRVQRNGDRAHQVEEIIHLELRKSGMAGARALPEFVISRLVLFFLSWLRLLRTSLYAAAESPTLA